MGRFLDLYAATHATLKRGAIRAACQRSTSKSLTAATASIQMDLAFVGGEGEQTKDLNRVLLAPLPDATTGRISSGRKRDYGAMFRERSERPVGTTQKDAIQKSFFGFSEGFLPPPRCPRRSFAVLHSLGEEARASMRRCLCRHAELAACCVRQRQP